MERAGDLFQKVGLDVDLARTDRQRVQAVVEQGGDHGTGALAVVFEGRADGGCVPRGNGFLESRTGRQHFRALAQALDFLIDQAAPDAIRSHQVTGHFSAGMAVDAGMYHEQDGGLQQHQQHQRQHHDAGGQPPAADVQALEQAQNHGIRPAIRTAMPGVSHTVGLAVVSA